jgi:DNA-binding transcriptional ArsR family regulator
VSQHLVALRKQGLLRAESKGLTMTYSLDLPAMAELVRTVSGFLTALATCPGCGKKTGCLCGVGK